MSAAINRSNTRKPGARRLSHRMKGCVQLKKKVDRKRKHERIAIERFQRENDTKSWYRDEEQ